MTAFHTADFETFENGDGPFSLCLGCGRIFDVLVPPAHDPTFVPFMEA
jgi:hypothetical protein